VSPSTGDQIGRGRTSDVFAYGTDQAIKLYPLDESRAGIEYESRAAQLAFEQGVPSVTCYGLAELDGRVGIVFERLEGLSLTAVAERDLRLFPGVCRALADCHARIHEVHGPDLRDVRELAVDLLDSPALSGLTPGEREVLRGHLRSLPDGDVLLHLDYHAQNVFEHKGGYAIIDWHSACRGAAASDVAMAVLLMREAELFPGTAPLKLVLYSATRRLMLRLYLKRYLAVTAVTLDQIAQWQTCARAIRLGLLNIESEREPLLRRIREAVEKGFR
jgi:Ser/Thr protein kinase RdoA (MazF antagonist)